VHFFTNSSNAAETPLVVENFAIHMPQYNLPTAHKIKVSLSVRPREGNPM